MTESREITVKFWGVRGSIAVPGPSTVKYGGNTTCLEIRCGKELLVIDAGTGVRALGLELAREKPERINLFLTHTHFDHICGIPFFQPAYLADSPVHFWAGHLPKGTHLKDVLCQMMMAPLFPVPLHVFSTCHYHDFDCGEPISLGGGVKLTTCPLNHPDGACGYRIEFAGKSVCVITDTEHKRGELDRAVIDFVAGADLMIYDATYTDGEYPNHVDWGHSTWQEALRVGDAAGVGTVVLFHHDPAHDDAFMDDVAQKADAARPGTIVARE
ncbi:MAG: MBL fold metallo-hydrolase, partial [Inquilinus sp.]|nr:MBL fold metallo-hydrolase [Inquilinus sp.]